MDVPFILFTASDPRPSGATPPAHKKAVEVCNESEVKYNRSAQSFTSSMQSSYSQQHELPGVGEGQDEIGQ